MWRREVNTLEMAGQSTDAVTRQIPLLILGRPMSLPFMQTEP